ncbi:hypothetical protein EC957_000164 [Mortierella hygrophila]|uniref:Peptidase A1 domain-containing protein n=1 Tax=Mortierella hygrophila TaxID=979708 RepID=A0A9P6K873_9FUNG|nr:hypothetical protein EC957_000164 [Mortierella hygrophila]
MELWYYAAGSAVSILNVLRNNTLLPRNMIGIWLQSTTPNGRSSGSAGGEITFGGVDTTKFHGDITYVDCAGERPRNYGWKPVGGITVGSTKINTTQGGLWHMSCSGNTVVTMIFGTLTFQILYTHLALQSARLKTQQGDYCLSAVMFPSGSMVSIQGWLIGDVFLKNVYSVFDFGTNAATGGKIGFAHLGAGELNNGAAAGVGVIRGRMTGLILAVLSVIYTMI